MWAREGDSPPECGNATKRKTPGGRRPRRTGLEFNVVRSALGFGCGGSHLKARTDPGPEDLDTRYEHGMYAFGIALA